MTEKSLVARLQFLADQIENRMEYIETSCLSNNHLSQEEKHHLQIRFTGFKECLSLIEELFEDIIYKKEDL